MTWEIAPDQGVDGVKLGDHRTDIRNRFGEARTFRRGVGGRETDHFVSVGLLVTYGDDDRVEFIEVAPPATPTLAGIPLLGRPLTNISSDLAHAGSGPIEDMDGASFSLRGSRVRLYAPGEVVEAVSIGE